MNESDDDLRFLNDVNSSAYIDEILRVQENVHFSPLKLKEQQQKFKAFQEGGKYDEIFNGQYLKAGRRY